MALLMARSSRLTAHLGIEDLKFATVVRLILALSICATLAHGEEPSVDLEASTPAIVKIKARMAARDAKLEAYKNSGEAGEGLTGLAEARAVSSLDLAARKTLHDVLAAENEDRAALFRELALANRLADAAPVIAAYARARRAAAPPEHWVRNPQSKEWVQKKNLSE